MGYLTGTMAPPDPTEERPAALGRLVQVFASASIPEGLLAKGFLESEGIPVFVKGEGEGPYRMGPVYLWVPEEVEVQARLLLAEVRARADAHDAEDPEDAEVEEPEDA